MNYVDAKFINNLSNILNFGSRDENPRPRYASDGKLANTKFITQVYEEYNLHNDEFPITTLRPIPWKNAIKELLWIYQDQTSDLSVLENKYGIKWWREWEVDGSNTIGQRYGATVKKYDLINKLLNGIKNNPFGRRHILNLWQENDFNETDGLLPCAFMSIYTVRKTEGKYYLDSTLIQRSSDYIVAGHINLIQYAALQMMIAHECGMEVGKFARFTQNLHIYDRHIGQANELLNRQPSIKTPKLILEAKGKSFYDITINDFTMVDYHPVKPQLKFDLGI